MGNASLRSIAEIEDENISKLNGEVVAVDAANWLYKYLTTTTQWTNTRAYTTPNGEEVPNLIGILRGLPKFYSNDIRPIFVFDGGYHDLKGGELSDRKEKRDEAAEKAEVAKEEGNSIKASIFESRSQRLTDTIVNTSKELLDILDVPYMVAPEAGESQASYMTNNSDIDYVVSEDYDALLFKAQNTVRDFTSSGDSIENMNFAKTIEKHQLTHLQLVDIALLCGTDYNEGVSGIGPSRALTGIKNHGSIEGVLSEYDASIENIDVLRDIFLEPNVSDTWPDSEYPNPNIDAAKQYVVEDWNVAEEEVSSSFEKLSDCMNQTGLGDWM